MKLTVESGDFLRIWFEDRTSKKQWQTDKLGAEDFVGVNAAIPGATVTEHAICFINWLNLCTDDGNSVELVNSDGEEGDLELHLGVKVKVFASEWKPKYTFLLKQVALEPVNRVFAKLRDQEEWIREQDAKIATLEDERHKLTQQATPPKKARTSTALTAPTIPRFFHAEATTKVAKDQLILWQITDNTRTDSGDRALAAASDRIVPQSAGVFVMHIFVSHSSTKSDMVFDVLLNASFVTSCIDTGAYGSSRTLDHGTSSLCHVTRVVRDDVLSVTYRGNRICAI